MDQVFFPIVKQYLKKSETSPIIVVIRSPMPDSTPSPYLSLAGIASSAFDRHDYYFRPEERQTKMKLQERFQKKLASANKCREEKGDPIARVSALIDVTEERAEKVLDEHKGYRFVSKKS